jgi:hypothetical protein
MNRHSHTRPASLRMGHFARHSTRGARSNPLIKPYSFAPSRPRPTQGGGTQTRDVPLVRAPAVRAIVDTPPPLFQQQGGFPSVWRAEEKVLHARQARRDSLTTAVREPGHHLSFASIRRCPALRRASCPSHFAFHLAQRHASGEA